MVEYSKGHKPRDMDAAVGGLVLERTRDWRKDPDDFHPMGSGLSGPENAQSYAKGDGVPNVSKREGDSKSEKAIKPRK